MAPRPVRSGARIERWNAVMLAVIGGSGLSRLSELTEARRLDAATAWGEPSAPLLCGKLDGRPVVFLARHGDPHRIPPHRINYRANIEALKQLGVTRILAVNTVGGLVPATPPGALVIPDQLIDYTWGRAATFYDQDSAAVVHTDFTDPYAGELRRLLLAAGKQAGIVLLDGGCYGCTQGPRFETAADIRKLVADGCTLVGMTGMPEAFLARERGIDYACCCLVVNWGAGQTCGGITLQSIEAVMGEGMARVRRLLNQVCELAD